MRRVVGIFGGLLLYTSAGTAQAAPREHVLPERNADRSTRGNTWTAAGAWLRSPAIRGTGNSYRVAALASVHDARTVPLQARGVRADATGACVPGRDAGPWTNLEETFTGSELRVAVVDLEATFECAQLRIAAEDHMVVGDLQWELLEPAYPDVGAASRSLTTPPDPQHVLSSELQTLGVISREAWGARATNCVSPEDDWYRMAIHHTAGPQTANGSIIERLQGTQAYAMDSGGYCDIPYQMLVGFDGTLYEGRDLTLASGATGGGNNPGNLAVCFIGCYHTPDSDCVGGVGHDPTPEMMQRGQLFVQTLALLEDIPTTEDAIRGHRDWPGNSTACPGSLLHPRLGELRETLTWFSATEVGRSWDEGEVEVPVGVPTGLWIELENTGGFAWVPGETFLAPTAPRDAASPLYDASWPSETRAATLDAVVEPGEVGRFSLNVTVSEEGSVTQTFGLVHDGITWFADPPWGGGPTDDAVELTVRGVEEDPGTADGTAGGGSTGSSDDTGGDDAGPEGSTGLPGGTGGGTDGSLPLPPAGDGDSDGCGCRSTPDDAPWGLALVVLLAVRRRRDA